MANPRLPNTNTPLVLVLVLTSTASIGYSCSSTPEKVRRPSSNSAAALPPGTPIDPFVEAETLKLNTVAPDEASQKNFDFTIPSEIVWSSASEVALAHGDGKSVLFDFKKSSWTSVHTSITAGEYQTLFDFRESGFFGATSEVLSLRVGEGQIIQLQASDTQGSPVAANPGFVSFMDGEVVQVVMSIEGKARLLPLVTAPSGMTMVYPCNKHCLLWGFDGTRIHTYNLETGWNALTQTIQLPQGEPITRMALRFRDSNNPLAVESIFVQMESGALFAQVAASVAPAAPVWDDVRRISSTFCVSCHLDDGFEKEDTWKSLKANIVIRLTADVGSKIAMPPSETTPGKEMSQGEKNVILAWIEKQDQIERGEIGETEDPVDDTTETTGELKRLADLYCVSCHTDGKRNAFWALKQGDAIARISSGNMPLGNSMPAADKAKFLDVLNALK